MFVFDQGHRARCAPKTRLTELKNIIHFSLGLRRPLQANFLLSLSLIHALRLGGFSLIHTCLLTTNALSAEVELTLEASNDTPSTREDSESPTNVEKIVSQPSAVWSFTTQCFLLILCAKDDWSLPRLDA